MLTNCCRPTLVALLFTCTPAPAQVVVDTETGHAYEFVPTLLSWEQARAFAEARTYLGVQGHLATVGSTRESDWLFAQFGATPGWLGPWLGGSQPAGSMEPDQGWTWVTGEPWTYINWGQGEPNNYPLAPSGQEQHLSMFGLGGTSPGKWNDVDGSPIGWVSSSIVEFEPPPVPGQFALVSPQDMASVSTLTPVLQWSPATGAAEYHLQVDDEQDFQSPLVDVASLSSSPLVVPAGLLAVGHSYYWRVLAVNNGGSTASTPAIAAFSVQPPPCLGDATGDGAVNFIDVTAVLTSWGGTGPIGDANHDGQVDFGDITAVLTNFNSSCP